MSKPDPNTKRKIPLIIIVSARPEQVTLTQFVSPTPKKSKPNISNATRYMVSRKLTTFQHIKVKCIVKNSQPTMTQTFKPVNESLSVKDEPFRFTQLNDDFPNSPSASVIDLRSQESEELSIDLLNDELLTQAEGSPISHLGPFVSTASDTQHVINNETKIELQTSMVSKTFGYGSDWNDANPGDMVMATASDIGHPAYSSGVIGCSYVMFGSVVEFVYMDWDTGNCDEDWDGIILQHERIRVKWMDVGGKRGGNWYVTPVVTQWLKVIGKKGDDRLDGINVFVKEEIMKSFFHSKKEGWSALKRE